MKPCTVLHLDDVSCSFGELLAPGSSTRHSRTWSKVMKKKLASVFIALVASIGWAQAAETPGVTKTEIRIGGIFPFSGPASSVSAVGKGILAYVQSINDRGGINGRKVNYIALDDAYSPPKAVEHARRLVESDEIAFMYGQLGTPTNAATIKYLNSKGVPSIGFRSGSHKFANIKEYPLTTTALLSFDTEGRIVTQDTWPMRSPTARSRSSIRTTTLERTT